MDNDDDGDVVSYLQYPLLTMTLYAPQIEIEIILFLFPTVTIKIEDPSGILKLREHFKDRCVITVVLVPYISHVNNLWRHDVSYIMYVYIYNIHVYVTSQGHCLKFFIRYHM
jgi:hypothetical protein